MPGEPELRVRTGLEPWPPEGEEEREPLVAVRTGAAPVPAGAVPTEPLARLRGAAETALAELAADPLEPVCTAALPPPAPPAARRAVLRGRGGRSWWTTWIVRRITCVRTSATGVLAPLADGACAPGRTANAASAPATSAAASEAMCELLGRRGIRWLVLSTKTLSGAPPRAAQAPAKLWQRSAAGQSSRP